MDRKPTGKISGTAYRLHIAFIVLTVVAFAYLAWNSPLPLIISP